MGREQVGYGVLDGVHLVARCAGQAAAHYPRPAERGTQHEEIEEAAAHPGGYPGRKTGWVQAFVFPELTTTVLT